MTYDDVSIHQFENQHFNNFSILFLTTI